MKSLFSLITVLFITRLTFSQSLFDINVVHKIEIDFYAENWDHLLDSLASEGGETGSGTERILADVRIDGTAFDSCGVRYKGNSSMDTTSNKNPFNIDLNYTISDQEYQGKDKIKLANCFTDPSMVREALMYEISNLYMDAPRASFVQLFINGEYRGIYTNTESVDNEFLNNHFGSSDNPFFKCDPKTFDLGGDNSNLAYHSDLAAYDSLYDMKSEFGQAALQNLTYQLDFEPETIGDYLDVDRALWFLALSSAYVHNDGYSAFAHNYYVYQMPNGKWSIIIWDVNMAFGGLLWNGTNLLPLNFDGLAEQSPFIHQIAYDLRPLIAHLLSNPKYRRMYVAHYLTIIEETISNAYYLERAEAMHALIAPFVETEPYPHYPFEAFTTNIYDNIGLWTNLRPGLKSLMEAREPFLSGLTEFTFTQPTLSDIEPSESNPDPYSYVYITANVEEALNVELNYRHNEYDYFLTETMYDDGLHGDGAAADGIYGAEIPVLATDIHYYIYAENTNAGKFSPARAAYTYYNLSPRKGVVINELAAVNETIATDDDGDFDDWIELYNNSETNFSLSGYYLSDDLGNLTKWAFPDVTINAGEYLIIWADGDTTAPTGLHTNFKLAASGEILSLTNGDEQLVDQVSFPEQFQDISYGRFENGVGMFNYLTPTFNAYNSTLAGKEETITEKVNITAYPNPTSDRITISYSSDINSQIRIFSISGKHMYELELIDQHTINLNVSDWPKGVYILTDSNGLMSKFIVQ